MANEICLPTEHLKSIQELVRHVSVHSGSNFDLAVLVFEERGKPEYLEKNLSEQGENHPLVFSDKDDKPEVPSHNPSVFIILWDVKETRTLVAKSRAYSSRCCGLSSMVYHGWEGKCSEILATPSYSKNARVNKDI